LNIIIEAKMTGKPPFHAIGFKLKDDRPVRKYRDLAQILIHQARQLISNDDFSLHLQETGYA
jgi:hypothetical protein